MLHWAGSRDPILQRYGVGGVARVATSGGPGLADVAALGGLKTLVQALVQDDPQAQCYASAAVGAFVCSWQSPQQPRLAGMHFC